MTTIVFARAAGRSLEERTLGEVLDELLGNAGQTGDKGLTGLERKPSERKGKPTPEAALLTLRSDLVSMRGRLLKGAGRKSMLADLDYTIDQLDNALGEM